MPSIPSYKPSGKFEPTTFVFALGLGLVAAAGVGWLYQWFVDIVPLIYINLFATAGFGAALGAAVGFGARMGKCRNTMIVVAMTVLLAIAAEGATMYYAYQRTLSKAAENRAKRLSRGKAVSPEMVQKVRTQLQKHLTFEKYIKLKVKIGWKVRRSLKITGTFVYIVWLIELGILLVLGVMVSVPFVSAPFCERGNRWSDEVKLGDWAGVIPEAAEEAVAAADLNFFVDVEGIPTDDELPTLLSYTLYLCDTAGYLSVSLVTITTNEKGEDTTNTTELLEYAQVDSTQAEHLRHILGVVEG
ncbi:MAG: hypothetical protein EP343_08760 [Deltaproteobacteria bacterium]|nr:MAG: hypothetical protein EP343_08760 [Deltaproteobacteria bacterium]